jgi:UDP:flavonoid glycosyltransferase YjiC (YdhE family)
VQPYVALALGLRRAGHDVRAVAPGDLAALFSSEGFSVTPLSGSLEAVLRGSGGAAEIWASRVAALGAGPAAIPRRRLTEERLAAALREAVTDGAATARAKALGEALRAEDGVAAAVSRFPRE